MAHKPGRKENHRLSAVSGKTTNLISVMQPLRKRNRNSCFANRGGGGVENLARHLGPGFLFSLFPSLFFLRIFEKGRSRNELATGYSSVKYLNPKLLVHVLL